MTFLRSGPARWLALGLVFLVAGIVSTMRVPSTDSTTSGQVVARGFRLDGKQCYLTAAYTVGGTRFRVGSSRDERWCGYRHDDPIVVHYDSTDPGTATLTPRGRMQAGLVAIGLLGVALAGVTGLRRRRGSSQPPADSPDVPRASSP